MAYDFDQVVRNIGLNFIELETLRQENARLREEVEMYREWYNYPPNILKKLIKDAWRRECDSY